MVRLLSATGMGESAPCLGVTGPRVLSRPLYRALAPLVSRPPRAPPPSRLSLSSLSPRALSHRTASPHRALHYSRGTIFLHLCAALECAQPAFCPLPALPPSLCPPSHPPLALPPTRP